MGLIGDPEKWVSLSDLWLMQSLEELSIGSGGGGLIVEFPPL